MMPTRSRRSRAESGLARRPLASSASTRSVSRWRPGSWATSAIAGKRRSAASAVTSRPSSVTAPASGACSPASTRSSVDLPLPLAPEIVTTSPARASRLAPRSTGRPGWPATMPSIRARTGPPAGREGRAAAAGPAGSGSASRPARTASTRSAVGARAVGAVLGDHDRRPPGGQVAQHVHERRGGVLVELGGGLVEQHHPRAGGQDGGQRDPLALAARELADRAIAQVRRPRHLERLGHPRRDHARPGCRRSRSPKATSRSTAPSTAWDSGSWKTIPADAADARGRRAQRVVAVHHDPAGEAPAVEVGDQPAQGAQQRGLALARGPLEQEHLAGQDVQVDTARARGRPRRRR